jgi:pimeloyl-ACP methyl ester carboxylesterase
METLNMLRETWNGFDFWPYAEKIEASTLLIKGGESQSIPLKTVERMKKVIKDFSMVEVDGAGHEIPLDRPKEFEDAVRNYIK